MKEQLKRFYEASMYYERCGFKYMDTPWAVSLEAIDVTRPKDSVLFPLKDKFLVASAEQSFVELIRNGKMPLGKFYSFSPCFRGDVEDEIHHAYFMKLELIEFASPVAAKPLVVKLHEMIKSALDFFNVYAASEVIQTPDGFDIVSKGVELGSYGIRNFGQNYWVYGTGLAEPRLNFVLNMKN